VYNNALYVGGEFLNAGEKESQFIARWNKPTSCCEGTTGNVNMSGVIDLTDLSLIISYLTVTPRPVLPCPAEANVNGASVIDLTDLSLLISYLTVTPRPVLPNCP
jgi:hypothetical protein